MKRTYTELDREKQQRKQKRGTLKKRNIQREAEETEAVYVGKVSGKVVHEWTQETRVD